MSKIRKNSWTDAEETEVIKAVKRHPNNLSYAFIMASTVIGRTPLAISNRWYGSKHTPALKTRKRGIFTLNSALSKNNNLKVLRSEHIEANKPVSLWMKLKKLVQT